MDTTMTQYVLNHINWPAVIVAGVAYWIAGALWFSLLFGSTWTAELEKHGVKIQKPSSNAAMRMYVQTLVLNILVAFGVAVIMVALGMHELMPAIKVGLVLGVAFSLCTTAIANTWEGRSLKLTLIDAGYPVVGIVICSAILGVWI